MKKNVLRMLSFMLIAVFAFSVMGLCIGAEETVDFPVIEEITEEELAEVLPEEEVEEEVELFAEGNVAKIGDTEYATLNAAVSAAKDGEVITLLSDATFTSAITVSDKKITIDGANFTLTDGVASGSFTFNIKNGEALFKNIKLVQAAANKVTYGYFYLDKNGKVTLGDNAVLGGTASDALMTTGVGGAVWIQGGNAKFELNGEGAKIQYIHSKWNNGVIGVNSTYTGEINLLKGEIIGCKNTTSNGIVAAYGENMVVTVGDVTFSGNTGSDIQVMNGSSNQFGDSTSKASIIITGAANVPKIKANSSNVTFTGNFTGNVGLQLLDAAYPESFAKIADGATITGTVKGADGLALSVVEGKLVCPAHVCTVGATGYDTLQKAISAAPANGTVYLIKDISSPTRVYINNGKTFTINGNGHTYTDTGTKDNGATAMLVQSATNVTFTNITLKQPNKIAWKEANCRRENGFFGMSTGKLTFGDNAVLDGAAGANGGVCWITGSGTFILDGEGAVIKNADTTYGHGILAAYSSGGKIVIKNGTIENCTSTEGSIIKASGAGRTIEITGGNIINNTAKNGAVWATADGALTISGNAVIKDNVTPSNIVDGKETGLLPLNVYLPAGTYIRVNDNFTGEVGVTSNLIQFAEASSTGYTGLSGFFNDKTSVKGKYYTLGTKYPTDAAKATVEARYAGRETAIIFDYPFCFATPENDFLKQGYPAKNWADAMQGGQTTYLLRDIGIADVANAGAKEDLGHYHINIAAEGYTFTVDGNGFELKISEKNGEKNFSKKQHVFRIYNESTLVLKNFIYDGSEIMSFVDAGYVNETNLGGNLILDNCLIKNCAKANGGGAISFSDGSVTITNSVFDNVQSSNTGGAILLITPKVTDGSGNTILVMENTTIRNCDGSTGGAMDIQAGCTATITGSTFDTCEGSDGGAFRVRGTLNLSDSTISNCVTPGTSTNGAGVMVWAENASATLTDVVIDSCTGQASGGICVVQGTLKLLGDTEIKNCHSNANNAGMWIMENGKVIIGGNTKITENIAGDSNAVSNITNQGTLTLAADFKGNIGFANPGTVNVEDGLTSFAKVDSVFLDKDATKYPNITAEKKLGWELIPVATVATDSGWYYTDDAYDTYASETPGVIRFVTTFEAAPVSGCVEYFGTYALGTDMSDVSGITSVKTFTENAALVASGKAYIVDVVNIPKLEEGTESRTVYGMSYLKLKNIDTPVYFDTVTETIDAESKALVWTEA